MTTTNINIINEISQFIENANDKQLREISEMFSNMNVKNRNDELTKKFTEKILKKPNEKKNRYLSFLESSSVNALIWAPTQVGKSNSSW
jgi:Asp-tRNA(Asn)/Glu-tRNA(Gln) amidotransferase C subunit